MEMTSQLREKLESMSEKLHDNQAFLQNYMLDPSEDNRPAQEARVKELLSLAGEMEEVLSQLIEQEKSTIPESDEDINIEFKTHTLGCPDGENNIEADWNIDKEEMPALDDLLSEEQAPLDEVVEDAVSSEEDIETPVLSKKKKGKKHKKDKKGKKKNKK
jgi:hypothetical protein